MADSAPSERRLNDRVVVVTGASSGVGRAIARASGEQGAKVALIARAEEGLRVAAREVDAAGGESLVLPLDVADAEAIDGAAAAIVARFGRIDIWVNDAMVSVLAPISAMRADEFRRVTEVNYLGTVHGTLAALRYMRPRNAGLIVQIGSALSYRSIPLQSAYCASKAAIRGFTDSLRSELLHEKSDVCVTMLQLPAVNTPQFEVLRNKLGQHARPVPPTYQPEVIARAFLYAALHPSREMWIGWRTVNAIIGQRCIPGILDRYLARMAWGAQLTASLPPTTEDNLEAPLRGDPGAHGSFDREARAFSTQLWLRTHPAVVLLGAALALLVAMVVTGELVSAGG